MENRSIKRLAAAAGVFTLVILGSTAAFVAVEGMGWIDALYFSVVTVATVGYGDLHPVTALGKLLAVAVIITGAGSFLGVIANGTGLVLERRQNALRQERMNIIIGLFFSELGTRLLALLIQADPESAAKRERLAVGEPWKAADFASAEKWLAARPHDIDPDRLDLLEMRTFFASRRGILLRLLENPNLHEHEAFTDLLRAVFHLRDELQNRESLEGLPRPDRDHLAGDARRVYAILGPQWIVHARYLKANYPYLFSLVARTNPFRENPSAIVRS